MLSEYSTCILVCLTPPLLLGVILGALWTLRYHRRPVLVAAATVSFLSLLSSIVMSYIAVWGWNGTWRYVASLNAPPVGLEYQMGSGLFAETDKRTTKITDIVPICVPDGMTVIQGKPVAGVTVIENSRFYLIPPAQPVLQVTLNISFSIPSNESSYNNLVSYIAYTNGEIWCAERMEYEAGLGSWGEGMVMAWMALRKAAIAFIVSAAIGTVITNVVLEVYTRRQLKDCAE